MTSFGRGNEAVFEKLIEDNEVKIDRKNLDLEFTNATSDFKVRRNSHDNMITASNPHRRSGRDMLEKKEVLEERFFGREFDDNIHIQMIYNIMDIEKILSIHVNNAVYALNNVLNRGKDDDDEDVVGVMHSKDFESFKGNKAEAYEKFCKNIGKTQLAYLGLSHILCKPQILLQNDDIIYVVFYGLKAGFRLTAHSYNIAQN